MATVLLLHGGQFGDCLRHSPRHRPVFLADSPYRRFEPQVVPGHTSRSEPVEGTIRQLHPQTLGPGLDGMYSYRISTLQMSANENSFGTAVEHSAGRKVFDPLPGCRAPGSPRCILQVLLSLSRRRNHFVQLLLFGALANHPFYFADVHVASSAEVSAHHYYLEARRRASKL